MSAMTAPPLLAGPPAAPPSEPNWILETLERATEEWDARPEWTKPVVHRPFFAPRADIVGCDCAGCRGQY